MYLLKTNRMVLNRTWLLKFCLKVFSQYIGCGVAVGVLYKLADEKKLLSNKVSRGHW